MTIHWKAVEKYFTKVLRPVYSGEVGGGLFLVAILGPL